MPIPESHDGMDTNGCTGTSDTPDLGLGEYFFLGGGYSPNLLQASTGSDISPRLWARTRSSMQLCLSAGAASVTLHSLVDIWTQAGTSLHLASSDLRQNVFFVSLGRRRLDIKELC